MSKRYSVRVHLLNPLPVPFVFYIFVNSDGKLIALWQTRHFFKLLWTSQMYKAGIPPIHNNFHHFRQKTWICKWSGVWIGSDCGTKLKDFLFIFNSGNCQNTEISVCTFQFYESPYKYGRTFTRIMGLHWKHIYVHRQRDDWGRTVVDSFGLGTPSNS